jgi:hypothetical protein
MYFSSNLKQDPMVQYLQKQIKIKFSFCIKNGSFGVFLVKHSQKTLKVKIVEHTKKRA